MSEIVFGTFMCKGKVHKISAKGTETFQLIFIDDEDNKLVIKVTERVFGMFRWGEPLPWSMVKRQGTLG